ncbi:creatininase family protein [Nocardia farcinica]
MTGRNFGQLTAPGTSRLTPESILCLPIGSFEQHGPHLPLHTDAVIAEQFSARIVERYGDDFDLWQLPTLPYGLSLEHSWSAGTISLTTNTLSTLLRAVVAAYTRSVPARNLLIVNGHGGNRGILEAVLYELRRDCGVNACVLHPSSLSTAKIQTSLPEIHAGMRETSVMLALSPADVHIDRIPESFTEADLRRESIRDYILDRGVTWPWTSKDAEISSLGIMGSDPRGATSEIGEAIIESALNSCPPVLERLLKQEEFRST